MFVRYLKKKLTLIEILPLLVNFLFRHLEVLIVDYFQTIKKLLVQEQTSVLNCAPPSPLPANVLTLSFAQLGGDSIAAMRLAGLFDEHFNRVVSVQAIMTEPLQNILQLVLLKAHGVEVQTPSIDWSKEIVLDFINSDSHRHSQHPVVPTDGSTSVFLTGATGFLGQFILLELLKNPKCRHIYCLVRGTEGMVTKLTLNILGLLLRPIMF